MTPFTGFVHDTRFEDLLAGVHAVMKRSVLDTIGVAAVGSTTEIGRITCCATMSPRWSVVAWGWNAASRRRCTAWQPAPPTTRSATDEAGGSNPGWSRSSCPLVPAYEIAQGNQHDRFRQT